MTPNEPIRAGTRAQRGRGRLEQAQESVAGDLAAMVKLGRLRLREADTPFDTALRRMMEWMKTRIAAPRVVPAPGRTGQADA